MSAISLWNYLSCRIRLSPKTAEAFREGCAPILPPQSPSPGPAPWRHAPLKPSPRGPANPACAQPKALPFTLASVLLDFAFLARSAWRGVAVTGKGPACLPLSSPGVGPSVRLQKQCLPTSQSRAGVSRQDLPSGVMNTSVLPQNIYSMPPTPTYPTHSLPGGGGGGGLRRGGGRIRGSLCEQSLLQQTAESFLPGRSSRLPH